jgi:tetratricopeptide (TPR) repeat protein
MKLIILPLTFLSLLLGFVLFRKTADKKMTSLSSEDITLCGSVPGTGIQPMADGKFIVALPGWGNYSYPVSTVSDSSQFYFNQGLSMYYSYHFKEALASFKESARFDPSSPMAYWGQALTMGPYYNAAHSYTKPKTIPQVLELMNQNASNATAREKKLIAAMNARYSTDPTDSDRAALNKAYADKLRSFLKSDPDDEIKILYIDAIMLIHAWDFWNKDGSAKPWTPEVVALCEKVLKRNPKHPAALHYYIHLTEASRNPGLALGGAETLRDLLPGVAHMVHMSSHAYERSGLYAKGAEVNNLADDNLRYYDLLAKNLDLVKQSPHYFAVQTYCALTGGMYKDAMHYADRARKSVAPNHDGTYDQYLYMLPVMTMVRHGKWEEILKDNVTPDSQWTFASLLSDFAHGLAYLNTGRPDSAYASLERLKIKAKDPVLTKRRIPFNSPVQIAVIAEKILEGAILFEGNNKAKAFLAFGEAVAAEDKLIYTEPKDWPIPARQFLGAYLLKSGKPAAAEKIYREDLIFNPDNGWSLVGLHQSLRAQGKLGQLPKLEEKYRLSFVKADKIPTTSVYINEESTDTKH